MEGESGFVNLMRMKRAWFHSLRPKLMEAIARRTETDTPFREELFDKLYTFFNRYFCESGSIYFRHLSAFSRVYERVYEDGQDVALSWKTRMLYYVKSDVLVRSMPVELQDRGEYRIRKFFYFDASQVEHKQNNEKREFVFEFDKVVEEKGVRVVHIKVAYSQRGARTKINEILKKSRAGGVPLSDELLQRAFGIFRRQTEVDFFINKDARGFLREQFDLWVYQYIFQEETVFEEERIRQIQAIKETAYDIIDFIAQFEDELRRAWEKPKFVRGVNYVVTLDKLSGETLKKVTEHKGATAQIAEWQEFGMVDEKFSMKMLFNGQKSLSGGNGVNADYKFLPLDTKYFKDLELEILDGLGDLDEALDGELVHSENWQALNTLKKRYKGRVKCVHIDPPYNTKTSGFLYRNEYKHSSWLTMMENRVNAALGMLSGDGSFLCHIDEHEYERLQLLMGSTGLLDPGTVIWDKKNPMMGAKGVATQHEYILWRTRHEGNFYLKTAHIQSIIGKSQELIKKHGGVNDTVQKEFLRWVMGNERFTGGERAYHFLDSEGKVYRGVAMGAPELRIDKKFHKPILHPETGKPCLPPRNGWSRTPESIKKLIAKGEILFGRNESIQPQRKIYLTEESRRSISTIIENGRRGKKEIDSLGLEFPYCHPTSLYEELIHASSINGNGFTLDYFAGSGTTAHAIINLNRGDNGDRKYVLVEMGNYFHTVLLPRIKKVVYSADWRDGNPISRKGSSHCLKYYTLEQYEETLKKSHYEDGRQLELDSLKSPFEQYAFFGDDKLAHAVKPQKNGKLKIDLHALYPDLDIAESLSNILGKQIRKRTADTVTFEDDSMEKTNPAKMTEEEKLHFVSLIKPYLWWGK